MAAAPPINYSDPNLYEHLSLIVSEFEKAALRSGSRQGMLATAQGPLVAMDMVLESSDKALGMGRTAFAKTASDHVEPTTSTTDDGGAGGGTGTSSTGGGETPAAQTHNDLTFTAGPDPNAAGPSFQVGTTGSIGFDADFNDLLGGDGDPSTINGFGDWLADCFGCDLRIQFGWQLQPIDLLGPVADLLSDINAALDQFDGFIDPLGYLADLCDLLNGLNFLCIPDLITILMSLKMLLKSYLTQQLSIKIDWTLLVGPLLKLILDGIATLLQQIAGILVAPLDCAYAAIATVGKLYTELELTASVGAQVANRLADRTAGVAWDALAQQDPLKGLQDTEISAQGRFKDVDVSSQTVATDSGGLEVEIPVLQTSTRTADQSPSPGTDFTFPQGFEFDSRTRLPDALKNPMFFQSNAFVKMAMVVQEARNYIMDLVRKILLAIRSLEGLLTGSLSVSLGNLGLLLFVKDMINLVLLIIKMLSQFGEVDDWCAFLEENPQELERLLTGVTVEPDTERLKLMQGPKVVGEIKTCFNERSDSQSALLKQWIADLKRDGSN